MDATGHPVTMARSVTLHLKIGHQFTCSGASTLARILISPAEILVQLILPDCMQRPESITINCSLSFHITGSTCRLINHRNASTNILYINIEYIFVSEIMPLGLFLSCQSYNASLYRNILHKLLAIFSQYIDWMFEALVYGTGTYRRFKIVHTVLPLW